MNGLHKDRHNGFVYLARDGGLVKVGGAGSVKARMAQLRRNHKNIQLVAEIRADNYMLLEKLLHIQLKDFCVTNEWYKNEERVLRIVFDFLKNHGEIVGAYEISFPAPSRL